MQTAPGIRTLLERAGVTTPQLFCTVHTVDKEARQLATVYSSHPEPEPLGRWQSIGVGIIGRCAREGKAFTVLDVQTYHDYLEVYPGVRSELAVPVFANEEVSAVINFESTTPNFFEEWERSQRYKLLALEIAGYFELAREGHSAGSLLVPESALNTNNTGTLNIIVTDISDSLLRLLSKRPALMHELSPRKFEELVARLLADMGYSVTLTSVTKDGGYDILAETKLETGSILTLVECKKWSPRRPVSVELVRNIYGVLSFKGATQAMIATTSRFTSSAKQLQDAHKYRLSLREYEDLCSWLSRYNKEPHI